MIPRTRSVVHAFIALLAAWFAVGTAFAQTTAFSYQGKLTDGGNPASGNYDMQFALYNDIVSVGTGAQQGTTQGLNAVAVSNGVFTVTLDFGAPVFDGSDRYLQIGVRPAGSPNAYTQLSPRQRITSSPYAVQTLNAAQLGGLPANRYVATDADGNAALGAPAATHGRLDVIGATGSALYAECPTCIGVEGQSGSGIGVRGVSDSQYGVFGKSTSFIGVRGETDSASVPAVYGKSNAFNGLGVEGHSSDAGTGVYGTSISGTGSGGYSFSGTGMRGTSQQSVGVWGTSTDFEGVRGETSSSARSGVTGVQNNAGGGIGVYGYSPAGAGVQGNTLTGNGVVGGSLGGSGVYGESNVVSLTAGGVYGKNLSASLGIGVIGEANGSFATGVYGVSTDANGAGVVARNLNGAALIADGKARQSRASGGFAKALIFVNADGSINRCFNGTTGADSGGCGFLVSHSVTGSYILDFGFKVDDRFVQVTGLDNQASGCLGIDTSLIWVSGNQLRVTTACGSYEDGPFFVSIF